MFKKSTFSLSDAVRYKYFDFAEALIVNLDFKSDIICGVFHPSVELNERILLKQLILQQCLLIFTKCYRGHYYGLLLFSRVTS